MLTNYVRVCKFCIKRGISVFCSLFGVLSVGKRIFDEMRVRFAHHRPQRFLYRCFHLLAPVLPISALWFTVFDFGVRFRGQTAHFPSSKTSSLQSRTKTKGVSWSSNLRPKRFSSSSSFRLWSDLRISWSNLSTFLETQWIFTCNAKNRAYARVLKFPKLI